MYHDPCVRKASMLCADKAKGTQEFHTFMMNKRIGPLISHNNTRRPFPEEFSVLFDVPILDVVL